MPFQEPKGIAEQLTVSKSQTFLWVLFDTLIKTYAFSFVSDVPLSIDFPLVGFNKRAREIEALCTTLSAAELSEL